MKCFINGQRQFTECANIEYSRIHLVQYIYCFGILRFSSINGFIKHLIAFALAMDSIGIMALFIKHFKLVTLNSEKSYEKQLNDREIQSGGGRSMRYVRGSPLDRVGPLNFF